MAGIYFHIPFCKRICAYCDFFKSASLAKMEPVLRAMLRELAAAADFLPQRAVRTVYFGGGTPSLYPPEALGVLLARTAELFDCSELEEVTAEVNPDDLSADYLCGLLRAGIDRLSIGVQSFDAEQLRMMNRRHTAREATEAVETARRAGFGNISLDLIYGIPPGDEGPLLHSLGTLLALRPEHVSAYHLTIEPGTAFARRAERGLLSAVDEQVSERHFELVHGMLTEAGYEHYEISNFALPGRRARHNAAYWHGVPYLGIGPSAHSYNGAERRWAVASIDDYVAGAGSASIYRGELLGDADRYNEYVMTALRCCEGIDMRELQQRFGAHKLLAFRQAAARWLATGHLCRSGERIFIPAHRFLLTDSIVADLFL